MGNCFLCQPDRHLVYEESEHFFAMLGLGPIVDGYSILATRAHIPSMFDVPDAYLDELDQFMEVVAERLDTCFGAPVLTTEHGRIGLCEQVRRGHEPHCYHAHRLLFPTDIEISSAMLKSEISPLRFDHFRFARRGAGHLVEYLYYEGVEGPILVGNAPADVGRQFFRSAVAEAVGRAELRSWRAHPRRDVIEAARQRLLGAA